MINSATTMIGPMLGAFLLTMTILQWVMLVDVVGAIMAIVRLSLVKVSKHHVNESTKFDILNEMKQGLRVIVSNKALLRLFVPILIATIVLVPLGILLPLMVRVYFNGTAWHNGVVQSLFSFGMLVAAMLIGLTGGLKKQFLMISLSIGLLGLCSLIAGLLPSPLFWVFCIVVFFMGTTGVGFHVPFTAYIQRTVPPESLGKVISLMTSIMSFAAPVGMFIAGPASEIIGVSNWMVLAGILMSFIGLVCYVRTADTEANR